MADEPRCRIWWHLCIIGALIAAALGGMYVICTDLSNRVVASEVGSADARATRTEILRRLDRIEAKQDRIEDKLDELRRAP